MNTELILALAAFAFVSSITPGPNNLMLMASGANYGFRRTLPHMLGVGLGFMVMLLLVGLGLIQVFDAYPVSYTVLKVVSAAYLLFLAWKIATAAAQNSSEQNGRPFTFLQAAAFQWVNPKAIAMAFTAITVYAPSRDLSAVLVVALVFGGINFPCVSSWTVLGQQMKRFLMAPWRLRAFNIVMAVLLLGSLIPMLDL